MNSTSIKTIQRTITICVLCLSVFIMSCQKKTQSTSTTSTPKPATYYAAVNGSQLINFTPSKTSGGSISLIGTSTYYTITLTFPSTTGTGSFFFSDAGFSATIANGGINYVASATTTGTGSIQIDSIVGTKYYGLFSFVGAAPSGATLNVSQGYFSNL
jgi:hypothetical protein